MENTFSAFNIAQILGFIWGAIWIWSVSLKSDQRLNRIWIVNNIIGTVHFVLLGAWVGAANCSVNIFRSSLYLIKDWRKSKYKYHVMLALMTIFTIVSLFKFHDWTDIFPLYASYTTCIAFFVLTGIAGRVCIATGNLAWLIYTSYHHSYGGVLSQIAIIVISMTTIYRLHMDHKKSVPLEVEDAA